MTSEVTRSAEETERLGERLGAAAVAGMVFGLSGDLGAGKTAFVRGFVRGVGSTRRVHSPTFALLHEYGGGRFPVFHLDLYRLETPEEIRGAGLDEYLERPAGVTVAEWIERWEPVALPGSVCRVRFRVVDETTREITYDDRSA